jgi:hypothetical protein
MKHFIVGGAILLALGAQAQDMSMLDDLGEDSTQVEYATASYKSTRIINSASLENTAPGVLDLRISHRFGPMSDGIQEFFGLDNAVTRIGFDYGINKWLMVGIGRSTYEKAYDGFFKTKILRQSTGAKNMPISVQFLASTTIVGLANYYSDVTSDFVHRMSYSFQPIIGRKFSKNLTLQIMPTIVHRNLVSTREEENTVFAAGLGGRMKFSKRSALTFEGYYVPNGIRSDLQNYSLSVGVDIETGGHVFQLFLTNSIGINETQFMTQNFNDWGNGEIRIGFNISRVFTVKKNVE